MPSQFTTTPRSAVIVLNYNSSADCEKCISFLQKQEGVELEIIIVDNASKEEDKNTLKEFINSYNSSNSVTLTLIEASINAGYNAGNNIGLRYAAEKGYEYALIANPDMEFPDPLYIKKLLVPFNFPLGGEIVAVGSDILTTDGIHQNPKYKENQHWIKSFNWIKEYFSKKEPIQNNTPDWVMNPLVSGECRCLNGCCLLLKMNFLKEIGFFDERTFLYGEEPILARQVELAGKKMHYLAETTAIHAHKKCQEGTSAFCQKHWKNSQILYIRKYSKIPFYGRWFAELSSRLYFFALSMNSFLKKK